MSTEHEVYTFSSRDAKFTGDFAAHLPPVTCETCGESPGSAGTSHPLVPASILAPQGSEYYYEDIPEQRWSARRWPWAWFRWFAEQARPYLPVGAELTPFAGIGVFTPEVEGYPPLHLDDIEIASPGGPMFKLELIEKLHSQGFKVDYQPVKLPNRRGLSSAYGLVQAAAFRILDPKSWLNSNCTQCAICGAMKVKDFRKSGRLTECFFRIPEKFELPPLFRVVGYEGAVCLTPELYSCLNLLKIKHPPFISVGKLIR